MACLLPALLCLGTAVCVLLMEAEGPAVSRMYGSDLLGAWSGTLGAVLYAVGFLVVGTMFLSRRDV